MQKEMMAPTVSGTMNVLKACSAMSVQKLIVVSSGAAVTLNPSWPQDKLKDESCWSDKEFCKENEVSIAVQISPGKRASMIRDLNILGNR
jgi:nucleoside-diphosphate-sugar epimerase